MFLNKTVVATVPHTIKEETFRFTKFNRRIRSDHLNIWNFFIQALSTLWVAFKLKHYKVFSQRFLDTSNLTIPGHFKMATKFMPPFRTYASVVKSVRTYILKWLKSRNFFFKTSCMIVSFVIFVFENQGFVQSYEETAGTLRLLTRLS